jgi:mannose/fructose/N-acetylgalactosamine-specific phosphotransferase system component IIC
MKTDTIGKKMNYLSYGFLAFIIFAMFFFTIHSLITSFIDPPMIISYALALLGLIGIAIFGTLLAYLDIKNLEKRGVLNVE